MKTQALKKWGRGAFRGVGIVIVGFMAVTLLAACDEDDEFVDVTPPAIPNGVYSITADNQIILRWNPNRENDLAGYHVLSNTDGGNEYFIIATIDAFEEERMLAVMSAVSRRYSDPWGLDYETLGGYLHEIMETYDDLWVDYVLTRPEVGEGEVRIDIEFVLWGRYEGTKGTVIGSISDPCTATVLWREETPGWRFASTPELDIPELRDELDLRRKD